MATGKALANSAASTRVSVWPRSAYARAPFGAGGIKKLGMAWAWLGVDRIVISEEQAVNSFPNTPWDCHICRSVGIVGGVNNRHMWQSHGVFGFVSLPQISLGYGCASSGGYDRLR